MDKLSSFDFFAFVFAVSTLRYLFFSGVLFFLFYVFFQKKWAKRKIQLAFPKPTDYQREVGYSMLTMLIFAGMAWIIFRSPLSAYTLRYDDLSERGWGYWAFSVTIMIFIHDTYFYWAHRAMHHPSIYRLVHRVHHQSMNPSPWAAFAFHPLEAVIEAGIIVPIAFLLPFHASALLTFLLFMTLYNAYGHLGYELYPKQFHLTRVGRWINTSVAHNKHHEKFNGNYGLYFLFWDRWMKTLREEK